MLSHYPTTTLTSLLLCSSIILNTATAATSSGSPCGTYNMITNTTAIQPSQHYIVSPGTTCSGPSNCSVTVDGIITIYRYTNLTDITVNDEDAIFSLVSSTLGIDDTSSTTTNLTGEASFGVRVGQSGYASFSPEMICTNGTLGECSASGGIKNGTALILCVPAPAEKDCESIGKVKYPCAGGLFSWVNTTAAFAAEINCTACAEEAKEVKEGAAGGVVRAGNAMVLLGLGVAAFGVGLF